MVGFWRASPRGAGKWGGRSALFPPPPPSKILPGSFIPNRTLTACDAGASHRLSRLQKKPQMLQSYHLATAVKQSQKSSSEALLSVREEGSFSCPLRQPRSSSPLENTFAKKQLGRAQTTPCKLLANSHLLALPKAATCLRRLGLFRVSLQKRRSLQHARGKSLVRQPKLPCVAISERFFLLNNRKKPTKNPPHPQLTAPRRARKP